MQLVSIVVGTYNGEKYIETQLQSIIDQTYKSLEIIIVDDASQDNTIKIINDIAKNHDNIKVNAFKENLGYIKNFERGIALAKGSLIALSDQDDFWFHTKIEKLANNIKNHDLIYCDSVFTDNNLKLNGKKFSKNKNMISSKNPLNFLIENCVSGHAMLFKKSLFEKAKPFPDLIPHDWWLTFCATLNNGIIYLNKPLIKYRHHENNVIASSKIKKSTIQKRTEREQRLQHFCNITNTTNHKSKDIILKFNRTYKKSSLSNSINRMFLFFKYKNEVLIILKKSSFKKIIFCLNMFFKLK